MRFSERYGHKPAQRAMQIDSISPELRNGLWSLLKIYIWDHVYYSHAHGGAFLGEINAEITRFCTALWLDYFKKPLDTLNSNWRTVQMELRGYFFSCEWWEVYDFVEFCAQNFPYRDRDGFIADCNGLLEREGSAYRFVNRLVTKITDETEIAEIDAALEIARGPVRTHLYRALELLSDKKSPDYRNSIKESISGVESLVFQVVGEKGTLGQLIKKMEDEIGLHPALKSAFSNLYGYTSDQDGIRHAIMELKDLSFEDAKFFLVVCSAFTNFVESKAAAKNNK